MGEEGIGELARTGSCCSSVSLSLSREPRGKLSLETAPDLVWPLVSARGRGRAKVYFLEMDICIPTTGITVKMTSCWNYTHLEEIKK